MTTVAKPAENPGDDNGSNVLVIKAIAPDQTEVRFGQCPIEFQSGGSKCLDDDGQPVWDTELRIVVE